jgi:hypothetical protein
MNRKLGKFETALLLSDLHAPFNIVIALRLSDAPAPESVKQALASLQLRHPFLRSKINPKGHNPVFEPIDPGKFQFETVERVEADQWQGYVRREMAHRFDLISGPLFRVVYLYRQGIGDLIMTIHHTIADGVSVLNLIHELLQICSGQAIELIALKPLPAAEDRFPLTHQGIGRLVRTAGYARRQMGAMLGYIWRTRGKRIPPVRSGGQAQIATLVLPEGLVNQLSQVGRSKGITINSMLNTALVLAVNKHLYHGQPVLMRTFSFADVRPYTTPPTAACDLGSYVAMLDYTLDVRPEKGFWDHANRLQRLIAQSLNKGDKYNALLMSLPLVSMLIGMKVMRFGAAALNYNGYVPLSPRYGNLKVTGLHAFVSGMDLGPEMSTQARLFQDQLWWDFTYLDSDMDTQTAGAILEEITAILKSAVEPGQ